MTLYVNEGNKLINIVGLCFVVCMQCFNMLQNAFSYFIRPRSNGNVLHFLCSLACLSLNDWEIMAVR